MTNNRISLRDIYDAVNQLEDKIDARINRLDDRVQSVESKTDNLLGKVGIAVMVVSAFISSGIAYLFTILKRT